MSKHPLLAAPAALVAPPAGSPLWRKDFVFGSGTSSYPDRRRGLRGRPAALHLGHFCATPGKVLRGENGDVACDHYHRF